MEKYVVLNTNDRILRPFKIMLPKPPVNPALIDNYRKLAEKQRFEKVKIPAAINKVYKQAVNEFAKEKVSSPQRVLARCWEILSENRVKYTDEIEWIKKQWYHIKHGYWFYNNRVPTYITGHHYMYLNFWVMDDVKDVEFRERDRKFFILIEHILTTTKDHQDNDYLRRTLHGILYPKNRRDGATHKSLVVVYLETIFTRGLNIGAIQSLDGESSVAQYEKLTYSFRNLPFFLKPQWSGIGDEPKKKLNFTPNSYLSYLPALGNSIECATTSHRSHFDSRKVKAILVDEAGKTIGERVDERHDVLKKTIEVGSIIHGIMMYPSTTAEMEAENGKLYQNMAYNSFYHERDSGSGQTKTGLVTFFEPSCFGLEGFIDIYGKPVVEDPKEKDSWMLKHKTRDSNGKLMGARRYLLEKRRFILNQDNQEASELYQREIKLTPLEFLESFSGAEGGVGFDVHIIKTRINDLDYLESQGESPIVSGNLIWNINGNKFTAKEFIELGFNLIGGSTNNAVVEFTPDINGRFQISKHPKSPNKRILIDYSWFPVDTSTFVASADTITMLKKNQTAIKKSGFSLGSGAVFERLKKEDRSKNVTEYNSYNFVCDYLYRPSTVEEYLEEMLMMCVYYGTLMYPESNIMNIEDWFIKRGYSGYLLYARDNKGAFKDRAGFYSKEVSQDTLVKQLKRYFFLNGRRENHRRILAQSLNFKGVESLTDLDMLVSGGGCLLGDIELSRYDMFNQVQEESKISTKDFFDTWKY